MNIEFIIPTYNSPNKLMLILQSLVVQTDTSWTAHVIIDGMTNTYFDVKNHYQDNPHIRFSHIEGPNNDWGHTARNYGLDQASSTYVVMTGDDNYYVPTFVQEMLDATVDKPKMVMCNMVHNNAYGGYQVIDTAIKLSFIDIGNVMYKTDAIGDLRLDKTDYNADYTFASEFVGKSIKSLNDIEKISKILYVHN
jgi:glycosyltransferase involved in cell wall biosynthesis